MRRLFLSGYGNDISFAELDEETGALHVNLVSDGGVHPSYMALDAISNRAYAVSETGAGQVSAFNYDASGKLTKINTVSAEGDDPCHISIHPSRRWMLVSNYSSGTLTTLRIDESDGSLHPHHSFSPGKKVHQAIWNAEGSRAFVVCLGSDHIIVFTFDAETGTLLENPDVPVAVLPDGAGPRHIAFHPTGRWAYVVNELDATVARFSHAAVTGVLSEPLSVSTLPEGTAHAGNSTAHVAVSADGRFVYASNRGHNSIAIYSVNLSDGTLAPVGWETGGGKVNIPRDFALSPSDTWLVCANQGSATVSVFRRDTVSGLLTLTSDLALTPDSKPCFVGFLP